LTVSERVLGGCHGCCRFGGCKSAKL
jgi:hypothetical protein